MGNLVFQATLGGQVNLVGPNTASTFNINVPAIAGTMVTTGDTGTVTNTMLAGSIANAKLTNSSITLGGTSIALGASSSSITNDLTISGLTVGKGAGAVSTNTAVGYQAINSNSTAPYNTAVGYQALKSLTTLGYATAVGYGAGPAFVGNASESFGSTFLGTNSASVVTTGYDNSFVGAYSGYLTTTGTANTALGSGALRSNTTASNNTAVGYQAGYTNATGARNTFIGYQAGFTSNYNGNAYNTATGFQAGYSLTTGFENTLLGDEAGYGVTTGTWNCFVGAAAGYYVTTGSKNTIIGTYTGNQGGLDIRTASNYIVLSDGDGNPRVIVDNNGSVNIGRATSLYNGTGMTVSSASNTLNAIVTSQGQSAFAAVNTTNGTGTSASLVSFNVGSTGASQIGTITYNGTLTVYSTTSDQRLKKNIIDSSSGLEKLAGIKIRSFDWVEHDNHTDFGVVAQELYDVAPECVTKGDDGSEIERIWQVDTSVLVPAMIKAIQELKALVDTQATEIAQLKAKVA